MERVERPDAVSKGIKFGFSSSIASGNDVMTLRSLGFGYRPSNPLFENISLTVKRGDRLFLVGPNGCGKSTLIKILVEKLRPTSGHLEIGYNVNVGYYDQENQNLNTAGTVLEELWSTYPTLTELEIRSTLARFKFRGEDVYKLVGELSGGERARLTLSKLILSDVNLLVLDEPTNHLDIDSREALEEAILGFDGTLIAVSHDRYFLGKLATRMLDFSGAPSLDTTDIPVFKTGEGYEELLRDRQRRAERSSGVVTVAERTVSAGKEQYLQNKQRAADERREKNRIKRLGEEAARLEAEIEKIDTEMSGEAAYDYVRLAELDKRKTEAEERLLEIYEEIGV